MLPLLVLSPHSSGHVPADILRQMLGANVYDEGLREKRLKHVFNEGDPFTDLIFDLPDAHCLHAVVSRFVVDLNRFRDNVSANGVIKLLDFSEKALYPEGFCLTELEREMRLQRYFDSFHADIERILSTQPIKLLIDGHSMAIRGPNLGPDKGKVRPALTLMTGGDAKGEAKEGQPLSLPAKEARALKGLAEQHFAEVLETGSIAPVVALNSPWDSDEIAQTYANPARALSVPGFGLEINHALYMNTQFEPLPNRIEALNSAFAAFAKDAVSLFEVES